MADQAVRPRIDPETPISQLTVCVRAIIRSQAGPCSEGVIVRVDDPRVVLASECFSPFRDRLDG